MRRQRRAAASMRKQGIARGAREFTRNVIGGDSLFAVMICGSRVRMPRAVVLQQPARMRQRAGLLRSTSTCSDERIALAQEAAQQRIDEAAGAALPAARAPHPPRCSPPNCGAAREYSTWCSAQHQHAHAPAACMFCPGCSSASTSGASRRYQRSVPVWMARTAARSAGGASTRCSAASAVQPSSDAPGSSARAASASAVAPGADVLAATACVHSNTSGAHRCARGIQEIARADRPCGRRAAVAAAAPRRCRRPLRSASARRPSTVPGGAGAAATPLRDAAAQQLHRLTCSRVSATGQGLKARICRSMRAASAASRCALRHLESFAA